MASIDVLLTLLRVAIGTEPVAALSQKVNWKEVYDLAIAQDVDAVAFDGYQQLSHTLAKEDSIDEDATLKLTWIGMVANREKNYHHYREVVYRLAELWGHQCVRMMILKGLACGNYYPNPSHRRCGDLDVYLGGNYSKGNAILERHGIHIKQDYFRHSEAIYEGVCVENHRVLSSNRGPANMRRFEAKVRTIADDLFVKDKRLVVQPSPTFNALYIPWHVSFHFAFEQVVLRHLLDWALFIKRDAMLIDMDCYQYARKHFTYGFSQFADVLTALAVDKFHIPLHSLPEPMVEAYYHTDKILCNKVYENMLHGQLLQRRNGKFGVWTEKAKQAYSERWKFRSLYQVSTLGYLWFNVIGLLCHTGDKPSYNITI